jgi:formylglycine-generating enzyme
MLAAGFPALVGSAVAKGPMADHLKIVMDGKPDTAMQAFAAHLSDVEMAAVVTYERNAWGYNMGDSLQPSDVRTYAESPGRLATQRRAALFLDSKPSGASVFIDNSTELASSTAGGSPGESKTVAGMEFMWIPKGSFTMGSPASEANRDKDEKQHRVNLTQGYWLGATEVTKGQFKQFVRATAYKTTAENEGWCWIYDGEWQNKSGYSWKKLGFSQSDDHPVACVSWHDAKAYIKWLNRQGQGRFSLPTEAQWEYAARAGTTTAYSFGNDASQLGDYAWYGDNSGKETHAVASKKPNPWGLYDMRGNVSEWTADWYDKTYPSGATTDPTGGSSGSGRVFRGGGWDHGAQYLRSANRYFYSPGVRGSSIGFRLLLRTP